MIGLFFLSVGSGAARICVRVHEYICVLCDKSVLVYVSAHPYGEHVPLAHVCCIWVYGKTILSCVLRNQKMVFCVFLYHSPLYPLQAGSLTEHGWS